MKEKALTFHVPGHQHGRSLPPEFLALLTEYGAAADITEILGIDDIHAPHDQCLKAQELAAQAFGAERSYFLVNGSTVGNQAALLSTLGPEDTILVPRGSHRSIFSALLLCGCKAHFFPTKLHPELLCYLPPTACELQEVCNACPEARALFLTSPSYHGACAEWEAIMEVARARDLLVIVDEAWGAHLAFSEKLPGSAVHAGADLVVQSAHKMLGALTQSALLHLNGKRVRRRKLESVLRHLQTSSPSSLLVASIDCARRQMSLHGERMWATTVRRARSLADRVNRLEGYHCFKAPSGWDPTRLIVNALERGYTGPELALTLRKEHRIQAEMWELHQVLLLITPAHTAEDEDKLLSALSGLPTRENPVAFAKLGEAAERLACAQARGAPGNLSVRQTFQRETVSLKLEDAVDRINAELLYCYPPGVPLAFPGERLSQEVLEYIKTQASYGGSIQGASDPTLETVLTILDDHDK